MLELWVTATTQSLHGGDLKESAPKGVPDEIMKKLGKLGSVDEIADGDPEKSAEFAATIAGLIKDLLLKMQ